MPVMLELNASVLLQYELGLRCEASTQVPVLHVAKVNREDGLVKLQDE